MRLLRKGLAPGVAVAAALASVPPLALFAFNTHTAQPGHLPDGWRLKVNRGTPDVAVINEPRGPVLHMRSRNSSFALERAIDVDVNTYGFLTWTWKIADLPRAGDFRYATKDDQAAQVMVAFEDRRILSYIWDSNAPKGAMQSASRIPLVHIFAIVCRSGPADLNEWLTESRNIRDDYVRAYGHQPPRLKGVRLQINTQHTGASADAYFGDVAFRTAPM